MVRERRKRKRSQGDEFLRRTLMTLRSIEQISRGEAVDYTENYVDLVALKDQLGRRREDHRLGEMLCCTIESIAANLDSLMKRSSLPRLVKVTLETRGRYRMLSKHSAVGWEMERPRVGKSDKLIKRDGGVFRSAVVTDIQAHGFRAANSLYRLQAVH